MAEQDQTLSASQGNASGAGTNAAGAEHASAADRDRAPSSEQGETSQHEDNRVDAALLAEYAAEDSAGDLALGASEEDGVDPYAIAPHDDLDERALYGEARYGDDLYAYDPSDDAGLYDPFADDEDAPDPDGLPARGPLSFDPFLQAGADGIGEGGPSPEGLLPEGYAPPTRPEWLDALPKGERAKAESLFNGMANLHRETAEYRAFQHAVRDPERSTDAIYAQIERAARGFGMSPGAYLELLHPEGGDAYDPSSPDYGAIGGVPYARSFGPAAEGPGGPGEDPRGWTSDPLPDLGGPRPAGPEGVHGEAYAGDPYAGDSYGATSPEGPGEDLPFHGDLGLAPEQGGGWGAAVARAAQELLASDPDFAAFKEERETAHLQTARDEWRETHGALLAPQIAERLRGFRVTPEMVQHAYEQAYLRYDDAAMADPELAVKTAFRGDWDAFRDAELAQAGSGRRRAPAMARAAGSSPANPEYGPTARDARRFLQDHPDY